MLFAVTWTSHYLQDLGVKGYSMWKDELKGLDITHALKVVETQARYPYTPFHTGREIFLHMVPMVLAGV